MREKGIGKKERSERDNETLTKKKERKLEDGGQGNEVTI